MCVLSCVVLCPWLCVCLLLACVLCVVMYHEHSLCEKKILLVLARNMYDHAHDLGYTRLVAEWWGAPVMPHLHSKTQH